MAFDPARVKSLFLEASDLPSAEERAAYLDRECGGEPDLRARVEALLAVEDPSGPVPEPDATGAFQADLTATDLMTGAYVADNPSPSDLATGEHRPNGIASTFEGAPPTPRPAAFVPGQLIAGRYTLLEILGEGGMGTVYRAEQSQPVKRQVALKLIKVGMDSRVVLARFDAERQALAMMDHPNIARVYDGGTTEANQPFFVMELVQGTPITDYCDRHRLSVDARLQLFVAVCQAVQHAHQKGIIHRDLKPNNVMVTEVDGRPTPKVIDFGVAKATESNLTDQSLGDTGAIVGTPTYMSPEQADPSTLDIDTRTDVYALGVILYELLAGSPPLDASQFKRGALLEMLRMVREVDPSRPSTKVSTADALPSIAANRGIDPDRLKRELRGDLDWIVMKALEKDRTRRYETANGFGADILRHLASEPVLAAPPSRTYRLRKFVRKHRAGVIAASLVLSALLAGIVGTTLGLFEAKRQEGLAKVAERLTRDERDRAVKAEGQTREERDRALKAEAQARIEADKAKAINEFLTTDLLTQAEPANNAAEDHVTLLEVLDRAADKVGKRFTSKPEIEVALRKSIAKTYHGLASWNKAERQQRALMELARRPGAKPGDYYISEAELAHVLRHQGRFDEEVLAMARSATDGLKRTLGPDHPVTLSSMMNLAISYGALGRYAEALKLIEETLALTKTKLGPDHPETLNGMNNLANSYAGLGRQADALKLREEALALMKAKLGPDHPDMLNSMANLAHSYYALGRYADALMLGEEALALMKAKLGPDHPDTLNSTINLAQSYHALGRQADALKLREEALALSKAKLGTDHPTTLDSMINLAQSYHAFGRHADALKLNEEALPLMKAKLGPDHPETLRSMRNLVYSYNVLGRHADALMLGEETLALQKTKPGPDHPDTLLCMRNLAATYYALGRYADALMLGEEALALMKTKLGPDHPDTLLCMRNLAASYMVAGRTAEALSLLEKAADRKDTASSRRIAALQAWFGQDEGYAATRQSILAVAKGTNDAATARRTAQAGALRPSTDSAELEAVLALGRKAVELNKGAWELLALGMAEFRNGHFAAADEALLSATKAGKDVNAAGISAFYRAMSLFQLGKKVEAREVAIKAATLMKPLPKDEQNPMLDGATPDHLVLWLAYKEAKARIGFDPPPAPSAPDAK
jgi:eukaryotic-like serine/threonine-protein kinase